MGLSRFGRLSILAVLAIGGDLRAQERSPFPPFDGRRHVHVGEGVPRPGDYQPIETQIANLQKAKPSYHYEVVVVRSAGPKSSTATQVYADDLFRAWQEQAAANGRTLDEARSVIVVVAIDNHQVAVHPGRVLSALGLHGERIHHEVVEPSGFLDLARRSQYPESIAALLSRADQWIGEHATTTRRSVPSESTPVQARPGVAVPSPARSHEATGGSLATVLGLSIAVTLAAILGVAWFVHRRNRSRLDRRIKEVRSRATDVMDRLDTLKERLKLLPASDPDFKAPMAGETAALYARLQEVVGELWDRWLQVMDSVERAEKLALGITSPLKRKALHDAEATIDQKAAFEEIDAGAQSLTADMDRLNRAHEAARAELEAVIAARPKIDAQIDTIRELGLPITPYQEELAAISAEVDRAREQVAPDPIGARSIFEASRSQGEALVARIEQVARRFHEMHEVSSALGALEDQVAEHRSKGLRLDEESGNPDDSFGRANKVVMAAASALNAGDPDAAAKEIETARSAVEQARSTIEQVRNAREYCRREQPERHRATERLRSALPQAEADFHRLEREFAPGSWESVRSSLDQIHDLLASFERTASDAHVSASDDAQRYLAGAAMLRQLAQQQQAALRLMSGIGDRLNALSSARDECRRRRGELDAASRRVEGFFRQNGASAGPMALDILEQARKGRDAVLHAFEYPRPDWPSVREGVDRAMESFKVAQDQAEVDVRSHRQLAEEYERARAELERLAGLLSARREDRMAANRRFRSAAEALDQVGLDLAHPPGEWPRLLELVRGAVDDLEQADRLAREDIRLAAQAQSEIQEAIRAIDQARGYSEWGVGADTTAAESALARAEQLLGEQQYEHAIEGAGQAQRAARHAHQDAVQQASWRQMQADADRRRWEGGGSGMDDALAAGAAVAAGVILGNVLQGNAEAAPPAASEMPEPAVVPEPPPTDTSVSSWESDTGQSSW